MRIEKAAETAARKFKASRARANTIRIWQQARYMDTRATYAAVKAGAECLKESGIEDVRIEEVPSDGKLSAAGWIMPVNWSVSEAKLETADGGAVFAEYPANPQNVAVFTPPTPRGKWLQGGVVVTEDPAPQTNRTLGNKLSGRFLLLTKGCGSPATNRFAAENSALGVITITDCEYPDAAKFVNNAVPMDADSPCVPAFSLSKRAGSELCSRLKKDPSLELRGKIQGRRYSGTAPLLTGSVGSGEPSVYLCGHIDEIGAQDNASGCGVGIEALRVLKTLGPSAGKHPQYRTIRFFFSTEVRGIQMWQNRQENLPDFIGGLNMDMVGADPEKEPARMVVRTGFDHRPHFVSSVLPMAAGIADRISGGMIYSTAGNFISDGMLGIYYPGGHCSLEQKTGKTYHTSADTDKILRNKSLKWSGAAATSFLYMMTRMPNQDLLELAEKSRKSDSHVRKGRAVSANRTLVELKTIRTALRKPPGVLDGRNEQDYYRAGVDPTTGLWPETLDLKKIDERISAQEKKTARYRKPVRQADSRNAREQADRMVPLALFRGFLSFEDHVSPESIKELKSRTGLRPRWGAEKWLWMLTTFFRGKQTLLEAVEHLRSLGREVDLETAVKATNYLADKGMVRLRPILDSADIGRSLRELQIKPGSTVMLHASLSRFGYIRGGCRTIIEGVRKQIGPRGTMIMPTHSLSTLGKEPFTPDSPSRVGAVGEHFRKMKGVKRSSHPTHSVAAIGPEAGNLVSEHAPDKAAFDPEGFWGRFYDLNGHVLLMAPITSATIFHVGETWAGLPQRSCIAHSKAANGKRRLHHIPNAPLHVGHFGKTMAEPLMKEGRMKQTALGEDAVYCGRAKDMIDKSTEVNRQNPLVSLGKGGLCNCAFCRVLKKGIRDSG